MDTHPNIKRPAWWAYAKHCFVATAVLCGAAFAPTAEAVATFSSNASVAITASVVDVQGQVVSAPAGLEVTADASIFVIGTTLTGTATGDATSTLGSSAWDGVSGFDLLAQPLTIAAAASGSASAPPTSTAAAWSYNNFSVYVSYVETALADPVTVLLDLVINRAVAVVTDAPGETASAASFVSLITDDGETTYSEPGTTTVRYSIGIGDGAFFAVTGEVDANGSAAAAAAPEPGTAFLIVAGLAGLGALRRKKMVA